jgi:phosphoethanolamine N-methyltransferase
MSDTDTFYDADLVENLQYRYGDGRLSPGGADELRRLFDRVPVSGRQLLDFGCGLGGYDLDLVRDLDAARVTGVDVETELIAQARQRAADAGLSDRIEVRTVGTGRLPFADGTFDIAFSKDAVVHLADKARVLGELCRVTVRGGWLVIGDWFGSDDPMTPEMRAWATDGDETFEMASLNVMAGYLEELGLTDIQTVDRNAWFRDFCREEVARLDGPLFETYARRFGVEQARRSVANAKTRLLLAEQGQLRPGHLRARKPG